jgi:hydroxyacylglutathione hydrolase
MYLMKIDQIVVGPIRTNCYLLRSDSSEQMLIIDPGGNIELIKDRIQEMKGSPIGIVFTHGHMDHTAGAKGLAKFFHIPIMFHEKEHILGIKADRGLKEGDIIQIGSDTLEVFHSPGHTPGGILLVNYSQKIMFVGDTIFHRGIGRTDFGGNFHDLMISIRKNIMQNPKVDDTFILYPGHMEITTVGQERKYNPFREQFC